MSTLNINNDYIHLNSASSDKVVVEGNLGIGTTSPSNLLHIVASNLNASALIIQDNARRLQLGRDMIEARSTDGSTIQNLYIQPSGNTAFATNSGNVGIGTTSPGYKLDVAGDMGIDGYIYHNGDDSRIGFEGNDAIRMYTANSVRLQIDSSGNIGVGTTSASEKLTVEDKIGIKRSGVAAVATIQQTGTGTILNAPSGYHPLLIKHNGTELARFQYNGRVGIGVTSPTKDIDVAGSIKIGAGQMLTSNGSLILDIDNNDNETDRALQVTQHNGANELFRIQEDGNVGIGTTSPQGTLDVRSDASTSSAKIVVGNSTTTYNQAESGRIVFTEGGTLEHMELHYSGSTNNLSFNSPIDSTTGILTVARSNKVGIGTISPAAQLHIDGTWTGNRGTVSINGPANALTGIGITSNNVYRGGLIHRDGTAGQSLELTAYSSESLLFKTTNTTRLAITSSGDVGIGTASPSAALHVQKDVSGGFAGYLYNTQSTGGFGLSIRGGNSSSEDALRVQNVGGTYLLNVKGDGNVGIGKTNPLAPLDVAGNIYSDGNLVVNTIYSRTGASDLYLESRTGYGVNIRQSSGGSSIAYFDHDTLRVGIGTTSPSRKLHVIGGDVYVPTTSDTVGTGSYGGNSFELRNSATGEHFNVDIFNRTTSTWYTPFHIQNTGNVGIGVTDPSVELEVGGSTNTQILISATTTTGNSQLYFGDSTSDTAGVILYRHNGDSMAFEVNDSERMRIDSSGNVGIGTTSPSYVLDTVGSPVRFTRDSKFIIINPNFASLNTHANIQADTGMDLSFTTNAAERVRIDTSGNVGIGTSSPQQKLHIDGNIYLGPNNTNNFIHSGAHLGLQADGNVRIVSDVNDTADVGASDIIFGYGSSTNTDSNQDFTEAELSTYPRVEVMRIVASTNRVGIGTTSPSYTLDVAGQGKVTGKFRVGGAVMLAEPGTGVLLFGSEGGNQTAIYSASQERIRIDSSGNVGIGTTNPDTKLEVVGQASFGDNSTLSIRNDAFVTVRAAAFAGIDVSSLRTSGNIGGLRAYDSTGTSKGQLLLKVDGGLEFYNSASRLYITSSGNVGIGTTTPSTKLEVVSGTDAIAIRTSYPSNSSQVGALLWKDAVNTTGAIDTRYNGTTVDMHFGSLYNSGYNSTTRLVIKGNGNVGIGTTSPSYPLHVKSTESALIQIEGTTASNYTAIRYLGTGRTWSQGVGNASETLLGLANKFYLYDTTASATRLVVDTSGNVGIGTNNPIYKLQVAGSTYVNGGTLFLDTDQFLKWGNSNQGIKAVNDSNMSFYTGGSDRMTITSSGNVGIGTTSPSEKLHVTGTILSDQDEARIRFNSTSGTGRAYDMIGGNDGKFYFYDRTATSFRYVIDSSGNVGIGTTSPAQKLHVNGTFKSIGIQDSSTSQAIFINGNAEVGIGTTSPTTKLHVNGTSRVVKSKIDITPTSDTIALDVRGTGTPNDYFTVSNATGGANDVFLPIFFYKAATYGYNGGTNRYPSGVYGGGFVAAVDDTSYPSAAGAGAAMHFNARTYANNGPLTNRYLFSWGSWLTTHMAMTAGGNLLIGKTTDSGEELQVNGDADVSGDINADGDFYHNGTQGYTGNVTIQQPSPNPPITLEINGGIITNVT